MDAVRGVICGLLAAFIADMVELHAWLAGDAVAFLDGQGALIGILAIGAAACMLHPLLRPHGNLGLVGIVGGVLGLDFVMDYLTALAPDAVALAYGPGYLSAIEQGYSHSGVLGLFF